MSKVLAYTSPAIGHLFPMTPILLELQRRGHEVHLRTLPDRLDLMRGLGFETETIDPGIRALPSDDYGARNAKEALDRAAAMFCARGEVDGPDLERAIAQVDPDLVLVDTNSWGACDAAEARGGPWAIFSPYTPAISSRGTPPFGPGLTPMRGPLGRARDALVRPLVLGAVEKSMKPRMNALRARYGLAPVGSADEYFRRAPLMLVTTSEPFEYPHPDWGSRILMIGALPWEPDSERPEWLDDVERPVVMVTTSSEYQADEALVRAAVAGLRDEPYTVVATMPAGVKGVGDVPPNARVVQFAPHGHILERAAVAVTHGGMGATQKALAGAYRSAWSPSDVTRWRSPLGSCTPTPGPPRAQEARAGAVAACGPRRRHQEAGRRSVAKGFGAAGGAPAAVDALERLLSR